MQQELAAAVEAAREQGFRQGEAQARTAAEQALNEQRQAVASALKEFEQQRADYFRRVESEVVRLALAIARKVLHREAQMDPLLLAGVVRVALDQMQAGSRVVLRTSTGCGGELAQVLRGALPAKARPLKLSADSSSEGAGLRVAGRGGQYRDQPRRAVAGDSERLLRSVGRAARRHAMSNQVLVPTSACWNRDLP